MRTDDIIKALENPCALICDSCGQEHNCRAQGCAIMREAAARLKQVAKEREAAVKQLRRLADCDTCKHNHPCGMDGDPCTACMTGQCWEWDGGMPHDQ